MAEDLEHAAYDPAYDPTGEVVDICRDLIRMDTSNFGDASGPGERKAAEHVAALLDEVGIDAELIEGEPGRTSVIRPSMPKLSNAFERISDWAFSSSSVMRVRMPDGTVSNSSASGSW